MSANDLEREPDIAAELFVLAPDGDVPPQEAELDQGPANPSAG